MSAGGVLIRTQQLGPGEGMALTRMAAKRSGGTWPISRSVGLGGYDGLPLRLPRTIPVLCRSYRRPPALAANP
jgi:hypothetical protein